jgi:alpha-amylase/alpha-mannosidase (GH57 family)
MTKKREGEYQEPAAAFTLCGSPGGHSRMSRYVCIHGHFYQPPRENPWLEEVEVEDSAFPYHDWNERVTAECYGPNAASRILDPEKRIIDIVNNYSRISFNFGPTLLAWLEQHKPEVYAAILEADRESLKRYSGHGAAIAQVYNHIIMPLASSRDKHTQIRWGIEDFEHRFGRRPEGLWLAETAVDIETLDILAENGILFTILSPKQAGRVRKIGEENWAEVNRGTIDTSQPYLCRLPSGKSIALFFYDETLAQEVAFSNLLENGEVFASRMMQYFSRNQKADGLLTVASDGETYGHHHRFGDMALAYALYLIEAKHPARITIFGEYLELFPPTHEVGIFENTSWSCPHGIERWRSDCGCCTHGAIVRTIPSPLHTMHGLQKPPTLPVGCELSWRQKWRTPLRMAMDWLRDTLVPIYVDRMNSYVSDPWQARDDYIAVMLNRSQESVDAFFQNHAFRPLTKEDRVQASKLLEMQRNALLMYTSCGWFFDDVSGIEPVQVMQYACRAMQLLREVTGLDLEPEYTDILRQAPSNLAEYRNGAEVYRNFVKTAVVDLSRVGFHFALSSLVADSPDKVTIRNYTIRTESYERSVAGDLRLAVGKIFLRSEITGEENTLEFAVFYLGNHNFLGGARDSTDEDAFKRMQSELKSAFSMSDIPQLIIAIERHFGSRSYTLWDLFKDGQRKVLYHILNATLEDLEMEYRQIYRQYFPLLKVMREMQIPVPKALEDPVWHILNTDIRKALKSENIDTADLYILVHEMINGKFVPDAPVLEFAATRAVLTRMQQVTTSVDDIALLEKINAIFRTLAPLSLKYDLWECQNMFFRIGRARHAAMREKEKAGDEKARRWLTAFEELGRYLGVKCSC